ncbi:MAG: F0F1 ATP synthase subunit A, partial [Clostridia bacterium]|nr:F0F1 ATP synthase subunit A [Clostridia bacterium]
MSAKKTLAGRQKKTVIIAIAALCKWLTHDLKVRPTSKRQLAAEWLVENCTGLGTAKMGEAFRDFIPLIGAILSLSACSSLLALLGMYAPTAELNTVLGWALLVFGLITYYKIKTNGFVGYLKSFTGPVVVFTPFNILGEVATPVSMAFRHFGNVVSGSVISALVYAALAALSSVLLGWLPGLLGKIPFLR